MKIKDKISQNSQKQHSLPEFLKNGNILQNHRLW